jgi:hypothetical protein
MIEFGGAWNATYDSAMYDNRRVGDSMRSSWRVRTALACFVGVRRLLSAGCYALMTASKESLVVLRLLETNANDETGTTMPPLSLCDGHGWGAI